jgi:ABC-2 type transport system ATP-binding protein
MAHDTTAAVRFTGAAKRYGAVRAVDGLDLAIGRGETVALLGPNGAGKSTAIGLLLGLLDPDAGAVEVLGGTPERAVRRGRVGAMLQDGGLVSKVTVRELLAFAAGTYRRPMPVTDALAMAGLAGLAGRRVDRLSGGQAQRVRFALAVVGAPDVLVLDEPTAALDVEARHEFWAAMRAYAERGRTVLFSTHYLEEADANAGRVVVIARGRLVADGSSAEIKRAVAGTLVSFDLAGRPASWLAELPGVTAWEVRGDRASVRSTDSDATVMALAAQGAVRNLEVSNVRLEDAFMALTADRPEVA